MWQPTLRGGRLGQPRAVDVSDELAAHLRRLWFQIDSLEAGPRRSALIGELRTIMDVFALFPGAQVVELEDAAGEPLPASAGKRAA